MANYDDIPYPALSHVQTHPDSLATLGTLFGLSPASVEACQVLELGCASGGNLIPAALSLPGSTFLGIDYSAQQVLAGQANIRALNLNNISLRQLNVLDVTPALGQFDYIIAHGLYSWVPAEVREAVLRVCSQNLAPGGLAFVSYNTYPGWHMLGGLREMMLYHVRNVTDPAERAAQARGFVDLMANTAQHSGRGGVVMKAYSQFLQSELEQIGKQSDSYLLHDQLEEVNQPVYFHEFMTQAKSHGLEFVSELDFRSGNPGSLPDAARQALMSAAGDLIEMEQYLDFLRSRTFRQTLLCRQGADIDRRITPAILQRFRLGARAVPETAEPDIGGPSVQKFTGASGAALSIDHPLSKAAMLLLAELWPQTLAWAEVAPAARARLLAAAPGADIVARDEDIMAANLLKAYIYSDDLVELHLRQDRFTLTVSERPQASPWARLQAARSEDRVTNLRHERVQAGALAHALLLHLDGSRDQAGLVEALLAGAAQGGKLVLHQEGQSIADPHQARQVLGAEVYAALRWLARAALLVP